MSVAVMLVNLGVFVFHIGTFAGSGIKAITPR